MKHNQNLTLFRPTTVILIILTATPVLLHWALLLILSLNVPWIDDFFWYFDFLRRVDASDRLLEMIRVVVTPYNNHWHIVQRTILIGFTRIGLPINMIYFVLLGNLSFLVLFWLLFVKKSGKHVDISVGTGAAAWLFFQPISHYNFFECAFFNLPVLLFALLSIRAFSAGSRAAFVWAFLATISNGNGLLIWPVLALMALWHRDWKKVLLNGAAFTIVVLLYVTLSDGTKGPGKFNAKPFIEVILYFIQLCGKVVGGATFSEPWFLITAGLLILASVVMIAPRALKAHESLYFFMLFLLMSMAVIALTRKQVSGFTAQIVNHYLMFPQILFACLVYYFLQQYIVNPIGKFSLLVGAILISGTSYLLKLPDLNGHIAIKTGSLLNYEVTKKWLLYPPIQGVAEYQFANQSTAYAISKGYYQLPIQKKNFLPEPCTCQATADGDIQVNAGLQNRVLNRVLFVELTDKSNGKSFFTVDPYTSSVSDWISRKRNRRADATIYLHLLHDPIDAQSIVGCRLFTVK
jgi:hypothetical protein